MKNLNTRFKIVPRDYPTHESLILMVTEYQAKAIMAKESSQYPGHALGIQGEDDILIIERVGKTKGRIHNEFTLICSKLRLPNEIAKAKSSRSEKKEWRKWLEKWFSTYWFWNLTKSTKTALMQIVFTAKSMDPFEAFEEGKKKFKDYMVPFLKEIRKGKIVSVTRDIINSVNDDGFI